MDSGILARFGGPFFCFENDSPAWFADHFPLFCVWFLT